MMKPDTGGEATGKSTCRAFRGGWGQRAGKDPLRNLGDPAAQGVATLAGSPEETITRELALIWKSEGSVVARKRVTTVEQRDPTEN